MADTIKERIVQAVESALKAIVAGAVYKRSVEEVVRPRRFGDRYNPRDRCIGLIQDTCSRAAELDRLNGQIGWRMTLQIDYIIRVSDNPAETDPPMDAVLNEAEADVQKALTADPQWGGLAIDSDLGDVEYPDASGGMTGLTQALIVDFRVARTDPYAIV